MRKNLLVILFAVHFAGCERTELSTWSNEIKPVVFSIITPGRQIQVFVGKTGEESNNNDILFSENAIVTISDSLGNTTELRRKSSFSNIFVDKYNIVNLQQGRTYYLKVEISELEITAQTTIPNLKGKILEADCRVPANSSNNSESNYGYATLNVSMQLTEPNQFGYFLTAFDRPVNRGILYSNNYFDEYYFLAFDTETFPLHLMTTDMAYRKFLVSNYTDKSSTTSDINSIISSFGGVQPSYSNIENGVGLFGSFVKDSLIVKVIKCNSN